MKKIILYFVFFSVFSNLWAFGKLTQKLETALKDNNYNRYFTNLSLLFENKSIGDGINIIQLKKKIAKDLLKNFRIIDPVITQEFANRSNLQKKDFSNKETNALFFQKTNSDMLVYTELIEMPQKLLTSHTIFQANGKIIGELHQSFQKEPFLKKIIPKKQELKEQPLFASTSNNFFSQNNLDSIFPNSVQEAKDDILLQLINSSTKKNTNWIVYQPTAFFVEQQNIYANFHLENIEFARLQPDTFRYTLGYSQFELSFNLMAQNETVDHAYLRIKTLFYSHGGDEPPFNLAGGLRSRIFRREQGEQDDEEQIREDLSFFFVISGYVNPFNILYNFYLDNYSVGLGSRLFLPREFTLVLDTRFDYQSVQKERYVSLGIEHFPSANIGYSFGFSYFQETEQTEQTEDQPSGQEPEQEQEQEQTNITATNLGFHIIF